MQLTSAMHLLKILFKTATFSVYTHEETTSLVRNICIRIKFVNTNEPSAIFYLTKLHYFSKAEEDFML